MSSTLGPLLDKHATVPYNQMTAFTVREVLKELAGSGANMSEAMMAQEAKLLSSTQLDTLMKIVYVGLGSDSKQSAIWFKWHSAAFQVGGNGVIIRTLTDLPTISASSGAAEAPAA